MRLSRWRGPVAGALAGILVGVVAGRLLWRDRGPPQVTAAATLGLTPVGFAEIPGWREDDLAAAMPAFRAACAEIVRSGPRGGAEAATRLAGGPERWKAACHAALDVPSADPAAARAYFEREFAAYAVTDATSGNSTGLFTGYYEPEVAGSRVAAPGYATPLLTRPPDLLQVDLAPFAADLHGRRIFGRLREGGLAPYPGRIEIEAGALAGQGLEFLWLADPVDAFVLQIQGSGRVRLSDGAVVRVTYAGQNGRPYVAIGRVLADRGEIPLKSVSMPSIRAWLTAHPEQVKAVLDQNPSYVFFREAAELRPEEGPPGALGVRLTPGRSAAVDPAFLPLGIPIFVATTDPLGGAPLNRLLVAADTGGAIKGPVRADLFWGWDRDAETRAGLMRASGQAWVLLPRPTRSAAGA